MRSRAINCIAELYEDGHIVIPVEIVKQLGIKTKTLRRITILDETSKLDAKPFKSNLSGFFGKWQDERNADEIIAEIRSSRVNNNRSLNFNL